MPYCQLEWTPGHIWQTQIMSIKDISRFQYKYILKNEDNSLVWENGLNRIADLRMKVEESPENMWKVIEIFDEW